MALARFEIFSETIFQAEATDSTRNAVVQPLVYPHTDPMHGCHGSVNFSNPYSSSPLPWLPTDTWLNQFVGTMQDAMDYYAMIGAQTKDTLAKWRAANGLSAADDQNMVNFYNAQELGLGRRTVCRQNGTDPATATVACCVVKYGHVGGSVNEALDDTINNHAPGDTVCMEYSQGPAGGERFVKFYAYRPDGQLSPIPISIPAAPSMSLRSACTATDAAKTGK